MPESRAESTLDQLDPGERCVVVRLEGDVVNSRRLMELGLVPGTEVLFVRRAPLGDPLELRLRGVHISLRTSEAAHIHVAPL